MEGFAPKTYVADDNDSNGAWAEYERGRKGISDDGPVLRFAKSLAISAVVLPESRMILCLQRWFIAQRYLRNFTLGLDVQKLRISNSIICGLFVNSKDFVMRPT